MNQKAMPSRIIGLDYGLARIGIAISDENKIIAMPLVTLAAEKKSQATVEKLILEMQKHAQSQGYEIQEIVVGLPLMMSGKKGFLADEVAHFVELLRTSVSIPVVTWDERLTSVQAEKSLREGNLSRKKRSRFVDTVAAVIILQNFLDHKKLQQQ